MHENKVSSSLCLQKDFKSVVDAEIAQPKRMDRQLNSMNSSKSTHLADTLGAALESNTSDRPNAILDRSLLEFDSYMSRTRLEFRDKTFGDSEADCL